MSLAWAQVNISNKQPFFCPINSIRNANWNPWYVYLYLRAQVGFCVCSGEKEDLFRPPFRVLFLSHLVRKYVVIACFGTWPGANLNVVLRW